MKKISRFLFTFKFWLAFFVLSVLVLVPSVIRNFGGVMSSDFGFWYDVAGILYLVSGLSIMTAIVGLIFVIFIRVVGLVERKTLWKYGD
ncbi:MAG: hypothetical protein BMS9Abin02_1774 [Anaerolineae bacterium]|nr:MAG: hypothetical protein BMS9Abin02_1774 [Anaerolineae bacterium]